jgi:hypothetical protein
MVAVCDGRDEVLINVRYGIFGSSCTGRFGRFEIEGRSALEVIGRVTQTEQQSEPARRTARVLAEALAGARHRELDLELVEGTFDAATPGVPVALDDVLVPPRLAKQESLPNLEPHKFTVAVSESYRGG